MPLELEAAPGTQEIGGSDFDFGSPNQERSNSPLTASIGDRAGGALATFKVATAKAKEQPRQEPTKAVEKPVEQEQSREEALQSADKVETGKVDGEDKRTPEEKKSDANYGKPKVRWSELPPEKREYLTASEDRRRQKLEETETRAKAAEEKLAPIENELAELRAYKETAEKELGEWKGKAEKVTGELSERDKKLFAYNVRETQEYKQNVKDPWDKLYDENSELAELCHSMGLDGQLAYKAVALQDRGALNQLLKQLENSPLDKQVLLDANSKARALIAKDREYEAKGADALKEINERQGRAQQEATEAHRAEMAKARPGVVKAQISRFPFLDPNAKEINPELKAAIQQADKAIEGFDFNQLPPDRQAQFVEDAHKMVLAANVIDGYAANLTKEYQTYRTDTEAKLKERDDKIAALEKRLTNKESTTLAPGRSGQAVNGAQAPAKPTSPLAVLQQGIQDARRSG